MEIIGPYTPWEPPSDIQNDSQFWYKNDKLHREDGPAAIYADGTQYWYKDGKLHREDGPAIIYSYGSKYWYKYDKIHCEDGPAVILSGGNKYWYKDEIDIANDVYTWAKQCDIDLENITDCDKLLLKIFINSLEI
jgi:hypothetical protein